jgi:sulfate permease, SulP family
MAPLNTGSWVGDITGGSLAGLMSLPAAMAYGVLVFGSLGPEYTSAGVVSGLIGLAMLNLASAPFAGNKIVSCSPGALPTLMAAAAVPEMLNQVRELNPGAHPQTTVLVLLFTAMALAGVFQFIVARLNLGVLGKFVPYPITAGLLTGTGILILMSQAKSILGIASFTELLGGVLWGSVLVAAVTCATVLLVPHFLRTVPAPLVGLLNGTLAYYGFIALGGDALFGPVIGSIPSSIPAPRYAANIATTFSDTNLWGHAPQVLSLAFGLMVVSSLDSLVACVSGDALAETRSDISAELKAQGVGNLVTALFGGIMGVASSSRTVANYRYGGRTVRSRIVTGLFSLIVLVLIAPLVARVPVVVLAGLLVVVAFSLIDRWSLHTAWSLLRGTSIDWRVALSNLAIMLAVTGLMLFVGVVEAVAVGLLLSLVYFVVRMQKKTIRRRYAGDVFHSNSQRPVGEFNLLEAHGKEIQVLELEGSLFFGTADALLETIEKDLPTARCTIILDLHLVAEVDITGNRLLVRAAQICRQSGSALLLCMDQHSDIAAQLSDGEVMNEVTGDQVFEQVNDALDFAEETLLDRHLGTDRHKMAIPLQEMDVLAQFNDEQIERLRDLIVERRYESGETIFEQGADGDSVHLIQKGRVRIDIVVPGTALSRRIATLCAGTLLGEMAFIDQRPRSATATAFNEVVVWQIDRAKLVGIALEDPEIINRLLVGISYEIATRLRIANRRPK